ncbi:hypothetical protein GGI03_001682, partial [Coemansia sp. RSA 2337]
MESDKSLGGDTDAPTTPNSLSLQRRYSSDSDSSVDGTKRRKLGSDSEAQDESELPSAAGFKGT